MRSRYPVLKQLRYSVLLPIFLSINLIAVSQNKIITGKVTDSQNGSPLSNVSVIATGTTFGAQTDGKGYFHLTIPLSVRTLIYQLWGF